MFTYLFNLLLGGLFFILVILVIKTIKGDKKE